MRSAERVVHGVAAIVVVAVFAYSGSPRAEQQASTSAEPRPFADRASEGAGATIFGNVCETCHGSERVKEAMSPEMLKQLTPEKLYASMTTGSMKTHADAAQLTDDQRVRIRALNDESFQTILRLTEATGLDTKELEAAIEHPRARLRHLGSVKGDYYQRQNGNG